MDTHLVCSDHYYLAVHTFEEGLGEAVYDLGEVGEIAEVDWLTSPRFHVARLRMAVLSYPKYANAPGLRRATQEYEVEVSVASLRVSVRTSE